MLLLKLKPVNILFGVAIETLDTVNDPNGNSQEISVKFH